MGGALRRGEEMGGEKGGGEEKLPGRPPPCHLGVWLSHLPLPSLLLGPEEIGRRRRSRRRKSRRRRGGKNERIWKHWVGMEMRCWEKKKKRWKADGISRWHDSIQPRERRSTACTITWLHLHLYDPSKRCHVLGFEPRYLQACARACVYVSTFTTLDDLTGAACHDVHYIKWGCSR